MIGQIIVDAAHEKTYEVLYSKQTFYAYMRATCFYRELSFGLSENWGEIGAK